MRNKQHNLFQFFMIHYSILISVGFLASLGMTIFEILIHC
jgi:hypothetical protein